MSIVERCGQKKISGWVQVDPELKGQVDIKCNDLLIAKTAICHPVPFNGEIRNYGFARSVWDLWNYIGKGDEISVEYNGSPLPILKHGFRYVHAEEGKSRFSEVESLIKSGYIFDKKGVLAQPLNEQTRWMSRFFPAFEELRRVFSIEFGYELFVTYGTLLGCIRDGNFIPHDNDVDLTYVSKYAEAEEVKQEFLGICLRLVELGYRGFLQRHVFGIKSPARVDIVFSWFAPDGRFQTSFGYHGPEVLKSEIPLTEFESRNLGAYQVMVPKGAERVLDQLYGVNWRTPDPGFSHYSSSRRQDLRYLPTEEELAPVFWQQFYASNVLTEGSSFAEFVAKKFDKGALILDIGCGQGRDAIHFAREGFGVVAGDLSPAGIAQATNHWREMCKEANVDGSSLQFSVVDVSESTSVEKFLSNPVIVEAARNRRDIVVYLRFFIHAINDDEQATLLDTVFALLPSVRVAAEFRTDRDKDLPKFNAPHYRRYISGETFINELEGKYGCTTEYHHEGHGLSIYKGEDPYLCRVIARK